jgi:hypothetical protein
LFQLSEEEFSSLKSQIVISGWGGSVAIDLMPSRIRVWFSDTDHACGPKHFSA